MKTTMTATAATLLLAGMLAMAFSAVAAAHTETDPFVTDLIAGQYIDVGDVSVWNDGQYLYVKYETADDWCLSETHLHVSTALDEIPQTNGNPTPGHFDYEASHAPPVTEFTCMIELDGWVNGTGLYIAAHADVCGPGAEPMFAQGVLITVPLYAWADGINVGTATVAIVGENLVVTFDTIDGWKMLATHLYANPLPPLPWPPVWADFPYQHPGLEEVTADTYVIPLADLGVECNDMLHISTHASVIYYYDEWRWVKRDAWGDENPFDGWTKYFSVTLPCEHVCETAWGSGEGFPGDNWAMFFTYDVQ